MSAPLKKKEERRAYDVYETPEWAVKALLKVVPIDFNLKYLEPCRGSGRIYNHLPLGSAWGEIRQGVDYLNTEYNPVDIVLTNPPYSLAQEFVTKALGEADVVIMLLRLGFLESMRRWEWWQQNPLTSLLVLSKRPSFTDDGKTDGSGYAWFVWDKKNRLGLKPFYHLEGPTDERSTEHGENRRKRTKKSTGGDERCLQRDSGLGTQVCIEGDEGHGPDNGDTGALG
ncbi:hypothetical protein pEaSNUABM55_00154 [Erwinia phage pEa_SNUABM_55]|nr:hypothetical protein pEaSNUABM55_00154 [Erwinia phage pEa_SNUABM_55]